MNNRSHQTAVASKTKAPSSIKYEEIIESYLNRAQTFVYRQDYSRAIYELREAVKTYPNSVECHSKLSSLYYKSAQRKMAEIHAKRTLLLDPDNQEAAKIQQVLQKQQVSERKPKQAVKKESGLFGFFSKKVL
ncbi:MAG: hypothetical protein AAFZ80_10400 [Cyanobacteria bacterium P01_A01_bin.105]